jgi:hypothetical protein
MTTMVKQEARLTLRIPVVLLNGIEQMAARANVPVAVIARDLLQKGVTDKASAAAQAPLIEALHAVLPSYFGPLAEAVVAARFDAVMAGEMAQAAAMSSLLNQDGMTVDRAREVLTNTKGQAAKVAKRRVREKPELGPGPQGG